jgi:hypothetical protein
MDKLEKFGLLFVLLGLTIITDVSTREIGFTFFILGSLMFLFGDWRT